MSILRYLDVPGWYAGMKVQGITDSTLTHPKFPSLPKIMEEAAKAGGSCLVVSVNEEETTVLEWLRVNKFRKGPSSNSWNHGGRKTCLYFKQIPNSIYEECY